MCSDPLSGRTRRPAGRLVSPLARATVEATVWGRRAGGNPKAPVPACLIGVQCRLCRADKIAKSRRVNRLGKCAVRPAQAKDDGRNGALGPRARPGWTAMTPRRGGRGAHLTAGLPSLHSEWSRVRIADGPLGAVGGLASGRSDDGDRAGSAERADRPEPGRGVPGAVIDPEGPEVDGRARGGCSSPSGRWTGSRWRSARSR